MLVPILVLGAITVLIKGAGALLPHPPEHLARRLAGVAPALLAALVYVELADGDRVPDLDAKTGGVAVGAVLLAVRAPFAVAVIGGAAGAAVLRAIGAR